MGTRLLPKSELVKEKSIEKKNDIDQGLALARKIDTLRETAAQEESNLSKFRSESLFNIRNEIDDLIVRKGSLTNEIEALEAKRINLIKPLDVEWSKVRQKEIELTNYALELQERLDYLTQNQKDYQLKFEELELEEQRITDRERETIRLLAQANENKDKSTYLVRENSTILAKSIKEVNEREEEITRKKSEISVKEREIKLTVKRLEREDRDLSIIRVQLEDQRATLERALKRKI